MTGTDLIMNVTSITSQIFGFCQGGDRHCTSNSFQTIILRMIRICHHHNHPHIRHHGILLHITIWMLWLVWCMIDDQTTHTGNLIRRDIDQYRSVWIRYVECVVYIFFFFFLRMFVPPSFLVVQVLIVVVLIILVMMMKMYLALIPYCHIRINHDKGYHRSTGSSVMWMMNRVGILPIWVRRRRRRRWWQVRHNGG